VTEVAESFVAHIMVGGERIDLEIRLEESEKKTWGYYKNTPWLKISSYITNSQVTRTRTVSGDLVIVNWGSLQVVTYDNPWTDITKEHKVHAVGPSATCPHCGSAREEGFAKCGVCRKLYAATT
jgi:hypothetical protein